MFQYHDTWNALCQCLAAACGGSPLNQSYCTHLIPIVSFIFLDRFLFWRDVCGTAYLCTVSFEFHFPLILSQTHSRSVKNLHRLSTEHSEKNDTAPTNGKNALCSLKKRSSSKINHLYLSF